MEIHPLTGEFASPATEFSFLEHKQPQTRALLGFTLSFCTVFHLSFALTDLAALGFTPKFALLLAVRLFVAATASACAWLAYRRPLSVGATRLAASIAEAVGFGCFMLIAALRTGELPWHAMALSIMLIVVYLYIPNRLAYAMTMSLAATAVFVVLVLRLDPPPTPSLMTMGMLLVLANTFGTMAARRFNLVSREEFRSYAELQHAAERDHLTGCYNRRYLHDQLMGPELARAQRFGHSLTVVLCDIDNFKLINDTHGHADGDAVLLSFANLLKTMTRDKVDSVVRYGGEEFLAILPETELEGGIRLAERLRASFAATSTPSASGAAAVRTTASFGVACARFTREGSRTTLRDLIAAADKLMYEAKRSGRDCVQALQLR